MVKIQRLFAKTNLKIPVYLSGAILQQPSVSQNLKAHLRRFSHCRFRLVGKGLVRETLLPLPRLRGFGTHYIRCAQIRNLEFWNAESYAYCVSSPWQPKSKDVCWKLPCIRGLSAISYSSCFLIGTHLTGPGVLLLFSIKSKGEHLCFATRVLNGRSSYLHQAPFAQVWLNRKKNRSC